MAEPTTEDRVLYRPELQQLLGVGPETMRRYMKDGKLPKPDIDFSQKKRGWKLSTLRKAGVNVA